MIRSSKGAGVGVVVDPRAAPTPHVNPTKKIAKGRKLQGRKEWPTGRAIPKRPFPSKVKTSTKEAECG